MDGDQATMKERLLLMLLLAMPTMIFATTTILQQYNQTAQAFPCIGNGGKEYCTGYHDGQFKPIEITRLETI